MYLHPVTVPEGFTIKEMAPLFHSALSIEPDESVKAASNTQIISSLDPKADDLEGYLYPETYHFPKGTSAREIVAAMVSQFKQTFTSSWQNRAQKIHISVREIVNLASLIEKETAVRRKNLWFQRSFITASKKG